MYPLSFSEFMSCYDGNKYDGCVTCTKGMEGILILLYAYFCK